jgi:poly(3-hydroxybutyrate) depolymerase
MRARLLDPSGREVVAAETVAPDWASANGVATPTRNEDIPGLELPVRRISWTAAGRPPVVLYRIEGGAHGWPGSPRRLPPWMAGRVPGDLDATGILLSFAREILDPSTPAKD